MAFRGLLRTITIIFHHTIAISSRHLLGQIDYSGATFTTATQSGLPLLPRTNRYMAAAVWNKSIFLLGGFDNSQPINSFVEWDTIKQEMINYGSNYLTYGTWDNSQGWSQRDEILYMLESTTEDVIHKFNIKTKQFLTYYTVPITIQSYNGGCLASYENYLYVLGGTVSNTPVALTQILNMSSNSWISNPDPPLMTVTRHSLTCIVHPKRNTLYAIGGRNGGSSYPPSIELLSVDTDIRSEAWQRNTYDLLSAVSISRSVIYGDDILVIGGKGLADHSTAMQIINTITGEVSIEPNALSYKSGGHGVAILDGILYAFGGWQGSEIDECQYYTLPQITETTSNPTSHPSNNPTRNPSDAPTSHPTHDPTDNPSNEPSTAPTLISTMIPTSSPTKAPTLMPTKIPTKAPTLIPSSSPVLPSNKPSDLPTLSPILPPSYDPTLRTTTAAPLKPTIATYIVSTQLDDLKEGRVDEANNTMDNKSRYTLPPHKFNEDTTVKMVIYAAIVLVLAAFIYVLLRILYKRKTKRKQTQEKMEMNQEDHKNTVDDKDVMALMPGADVHHGSIDIKEPGMAKESVDLPELPDSVEKKKVLMTRRILSVGNEQQTNMNGGEIEGMYNNEKTVEGAHDVTPRPESNDNTETAMITDNGVHETMGDTLNTPHHTEYIDGNTDTGGC